MRRFLFALIAILGCQSQASPDPAPRRQTPRPSASATSPPVAPVAPMAVRPYLSFDAPRSNAPMVMVLHGYGSNPKIAADRLELAAVAKTMGMHIVVPEGTPDQAGMLIWNAGPACCDFDRTGIDDVRALRDVLKHAERGRAISRRIIVGFSNGAFMAHRLGCDAADVVDAIVALAGVVPDRCEPSDPVDVLHVHGTADKAVHFAGGTVLDRRDVVSHPSVPSTIDRWAKANGCKTEVLVSPPHAISNKPTTAVVRGGCKDDTRVGMWRVTGGSHFAGIDRKTLEAALRFVHKRASNLAEPQEQPMP